MRTQSYLSRSFAEICLSCLILATATSSLRADTSPWLLWKPGDTWQIEVDYYAPPLPGGQPSEIKVTYPLHVVVQGEQVVAKVPCWRLAFVSPSPAALAQVPKRYRVFVRKDNGRPIQVTLDNKKIADALLPIGDEQFITLFPKGVPLEIMPAQEARPSLLEVKFGSLRLTAEEVENNNQREAVLSKSGEPDVTVRQTWAPGGKWWNSYERIRGNHKELAARRILPAIAKDVPQKAAVIAQKAKGITAPERDPFELGKDPRLNVTMTWTKWKPTVGEVLSQLQASTGISVTAADSISLDQKAFDNLNLNSYPVWSLMTDVARTKALKGSWVKTDSGYHLEDVNMKSSIIVEKSRVMKFLAISLPTLFVMVLVLTFVRMRRAKAKSMPS